MGDYVFLLNPSEMAAQVEGWPEAIWLAVVRRGEDDASFALFHEVELSDALDRLAGDLPVFPAFGGRATARITFAEESKVLAAIAEQDDLGDLAAEYRLGHDREAAAAAGAAEPVPDAVEAPGGAALPVREPPREAPDSPGAPPDSPGAPPEEPVPAAAAAPRAGPPVALFAGADEIAEVAVSVRSSGGGAEFRVGRRLALEAGLGGAPAVSYDGTGLRAALVGAPGDGVVGPGPLVVPVPPSGVPAALRARLPRDWEPVPVERAGQGTVVADLSRLAPVPRRRPLALAALAAAALLAACAVGAAASALVAADRTAAAAAAVLHAAGRQDRPFLGDSQLRDMRDRLFGGAAPTGQGG